jgi:hypothetical protein
MTQHFQPDTSTLNRERLTARPVYAKTWNELQPEYGVSCFGNPPGYPSYFRQSVHGRDKSCVASVIVLDGVWYRIDASDWNSDTAAAILRSLWSPLPLDHPRTRLWIRDTYRQVHRCYGDVRIPKHRPGHLVFSELGELELATPENHLAVQSIRKFYPEYEPELELILHPPTRIEGLWWELLAEAPAPEECVDGHGWRHPINKTWCQWCGWYADEEA